MVTEFGIGNYHARVVTEHFLAAVEIVPAPDIGPDQILAQNPHDDFLLQCVFGAFVEHLNFQ